MLFCILIFCGLYSFTQRYITDDGFISFRYAQNLANGHGLVYNIGERVEGYTNFLWVLLMSVSFPLNLDIMMFSHVIGITLQLLTLVTVYLIGTNLFSEKKLRPHPHNSHCNQL